jgi:hypothetical protein
MDNRYSNENKQYNSANEGEGYTMLNLSGRESSFVANDSEVGELVKQSQAGANWFFWIAALSVINTIISVAGGRWSFLAGLGSTQIIDGLVIVLTESFGTLAIAIGLLLNLIAAAVFAVFGWLGTKRQSWAFIAGLICYGLDGLIFLLVQDWLSIAFHIFASYFIVKGLTATNKLNAMEEEKLVKGQSA